MSVLRETFSRREIETGLRWLDQALEQSEVLSGADVLPINVLSYGGMLSVCLFGNRESTRDVDILLPPNIRDSRAHRDEFTRLANGVADELDYMRDWVNDDLRLFVPEEERQRLLEDSIEQGVAVFEGSNLVIWAGLWEFGLESKLRRIKGNRGQSAAARSRLDKDTSDAVELAHRIRGNSAHPLAKSWVMGLRRYGDNTDVGDRAVERVARDYVARHHRQGIVELVWDGATGKHKYQDLAGNWVWHE